MSPDPAEETAPSAGRSSLRRFDSPVTDWPWWLGIVGLVLAVVFALIAAVIVEIPANALGAHITASGEPPGSVEIIDTILQDAIFVVTAVMLARSGLRKVSSRQFGLVRTPALRAATLVVLAFLLFFAFSVIWALLIKTNTEEKLLEQLGANEGTALLIGSAALTCVIAPICEEILFRGFLFTSLRNWRGPWPAAILTGLVFGLVHATSAPEQDLLPLAFLGFALCLLYRYTGSLYPCIAAHALNNSIAFGELEHWSVQGTVGLLLAAYAAIFMLIMIARRAGLIVPGQARRVDAEAGT